MFFILIFLNLATLHFYLFLCSFYFLVFLFFEFLFYFIKGIFVIGGTLTIFSSLGDIVQIESLGEDIVN
jgi:hypothetical protein